MTNQQTDAVAYTRLLESPLKTSANAALFTKHREVNLLPSLTIPDQTWTIEELIKRQKLGLGMQGQKVPIYEGEEDQLPDFKRLDLSEQYDYLEQARETIQKYRHQKNAENNKLFSEFQAYKKTQSKPNDEPKA